MRADVLGQRLGLSKAVGSWEGSSPACKQHVEFAAAWIPGAAHGLERLGKDWGDASPMITFRIMQL